MESVFRHPSAGGHRFCLGCGEEIQGNPRFCGNCGTEVQSLGASQLRSAPQGVMDDAFAASASSPSPRKPWALIVPLIAAGLVMLLLAGWLVSTSGHLNDTKKQLAAERSRVSSLNRQASRLDSQVNGLTADKEDLQTQSSSLSTAMTDCKEAAGKMRMVMVVASRVLQGTASPYDVRTAAKAAQRAWSVCKTEAATNGSF